MKYATWKLSWLNENYGVGPEVTIIGRGGSCEGVFFTGDSPKSIVVGVVDSDVSLDGLDEWELTEITQEQALTFAQALHGEASVDAEGNIVFPRPDLSV